MISSTEVTTALNRDGFAIVRKAVAAEAIDAFLTSPTAGQLNGAGMRNAHLLPQVGPLMEALCALAESVTGCEVIATRVILFDKTPAANWSVAWHQDTMIALAQRRDLPGYSGWSEKEGVIHAHPPAELMNQIITTRLHLDDCGPGSGALRVTAGSHRAGWLNDEQIADWTKKAPASSCFCHSGDVLVMNPLLLHASSSATKPAHRRVLHVDWAVSELPDGLQWHRAWTRRDPVSIH